MFYVNDPVGRNMKKRSFQLIGQLHSLVRKYKKSVWKIARQLFTNRPEGIFSEALISSLIDLPLRIS